MAGLPEVAAGQGSGLSWMGGGSSFDPIQYAQLALARKDEKDALDDKKAAEASKLLNYKPGKQLNIDLTTNTAEDIQGLQNHFTEEVKKNPSYLTTYKGQQDLLNRTSEVDLKSKRRERHAEMFDEYKKVIDGDKNTKLSSDKSYRNLSFFEQPEAHLDDLAFQPYRATYDEIVATLSEDPYYQRNPNRLVHDAREQFRDEVGDKLLRPVLKPESLFTIIKNNEDALYNTIKETKEKGGVTITEERVSPDGRTLTFSDKTTEFIPGTNTTSVNLYNGDEDARRSIDMYYDDLPENDKKKYANSQSPALDWWKDVVAESRGDVTKSLTREKTGGGSNFSIGGVRANEDVIFTPFDRKASYNRVGKLSAESNQRGWDIVDRNKKGLTIGGQHIRYYYDTKKNSHKKVMFESTGELENATAFKAPVMTGTTISKLKSELSSKTYGGMNAQEYFTRKFGPRFDGIEGDAPIDDVILGDDEIKFFQAVGMGKYIKDRKFASGKLKWSQSGEGDEGDKTRTINGAVIPLEDVDADFISKTGISLMNALDDPNSGFPDVNYNITPTNEANYRTVVPKTQTKVNKPKKYN